MPSFERDSKRIVIAGASSLLGAELKSLLEESRFAGWDFRLLDEELAAGTLTEAGGEPAVIQTVEEGSFDGAKFVFFTGSPEFTRRNVAGAKRGGAKIIDLSGGIAGDAAAAAWFPKLDALLGREFPSNAEAYAIPSAGAMAAAGLALGLSKSGLRRLAFLSFQSASEAGRAGIEELESQTSQLLSFQSVGQPVFDTQVAFNLVDRFGSASAQNLAAVRERLRAEARACIGKKAILPSIQILHAPVFYGSSFAAWAELDSGLHMGEIAKQCEDAGFALIAEGEAGPSNISAAGETVMQLGRPETDPAQAGSWWFWGAADNIRLPAWNAVKLAEKLAG
jgi:aspartate-semialdehyde dehydrogenase